MTLPLVGNDALWIGHIIIYLLLDVFVFSFVFVSCFVVIRCSLGSLPSWRWTRGGWTGPRHSPAPAVTLLFGGMANDEHSSIFVCSEIFSSATQCGPL